MAQRLFDGTRNDLDARGLVDVRTLKAVQNVAGAHQGDTTTGNNSLFDGSTRCSERIVDTVFLLFHLHLRGSADVENGYAARQLGQTLLQLLTVVVAGGGFDLRLDLSHATCDVIGRTCTIHNGRVVLVDRHFLSRSQHVQGGVLQFEATLFADNRTTGQDGDVFQHGLAAIAKARSLHSGHFQGTANLVHHQSAQGFTVHVFGDDDQRLTRLSHRLQNGQQLLHGRDLLVVDQDKGVFYVGNHFVGVRHKVGREVSAVKLHTLHDVHIGFRAFGFFYRDDPFLFHFGHGLSDQCSDRGIVVGGDRSDLLNLLIVVADFLGHHLQFADDGGDRLINPALEVHGVRSSRYVPVAVVDDRLGQNSGRRRAVSGNVRGLRSDLFDHLGAQILDFVFELDFLGYRDPVFCHRGGAEGFFNDYIAAFGTQGHLYRIGQSVHSGTKSVTRRNVIFDVFCTHVSLDLKFK